MIRKIICIDENKCIGCGLCAHACQEGAIGMVDGKARLLREDYCDGLGNCLPACPTNAITFVEREAPAFDEAAVRASQQRRLRLLKAAAPARRFVSSIPESLPRMRPALLSCVSGPASCAWRRSARRILRVRNC